MQLILFHQPELLVFLNNSLSAQ